MTSAQTMQSSNRRALRAGGPAFRVARRSVLTMLILMSAVACSSPPRTDLIAPYARNQVWAVIPPLNETGVSDVDTARIADMLTQELQQVDGVDVLPVNRTLLAMRQSGIVAVVTESDVQTLIDVLDVDGVLVGSLTAWDPYPPPTLGLALQLHVRVVDEARTTIDPVNVTRSTRGEISPGKWQGVEPVAQTAGVFTPRDAVLRQQLENYAATRSDGTAYGSDVYVVSMDLFTKFVSHQLIRNLLQDERFRLTRMVASQEGR